MPKFLNYIINILLIILFVTTTGCNTKQLASDRPIQAEEKRRKNIDEGRGVSLGGLVGKARGGTNYEFSTSNPMWRATLDILDFLPLSTVDYSGGVIISDWYTDSSNKNQALKITVRFLSNTVQSNSIKVNVHRKKCSVNQNCNVELFKSRIQEELIASILKEAAILQKKQKK